MLKAHQQLVAGFANVESDPFYVERGSIYVERTYFYVERTSRYAENPTFYVEKNQTHAEREIQNKRAPHYRAPLKLTSYSFIAATFSFTSSIFRILLSQHFWLKSTGYSSGFIIRLYSSQSAFRFCFKYSRASSKHGSS